MPDLALTRHQRRAHLWQPRDRSRIRSEAVGDHALWLAQPSALGGLLVTIVDFEGTGGRLVPMGELLEGPASLERLYDTGPTPDEPLVRDVRLERGGLAIDAANEPFAMVLHVTGGGA